jgi:hypothetical protein
MGEIIESRQIQNSMTGEGVIQMLINCNDLQLDVCINEHDLLGEAEIGRRFKGIVWVQGFINFPDE